MAPNTATSTRMADSMLGMSPGEVRLLLFAHLCTDKKTGKVCTSYMQPKKYLTIYVT